MNSTVAITGNTYPVRDQLRALGATWDAAEKAWMVHPDQAERAVTLAPGLRRSDHPVSETDLHAAMLARRAAKDARDVALVELNARMTAIRNDISARKKAGHVFSAAEKASINHEMDDITAEMRRLAPEIYTGRLAGQDAEDDYRQPSTRGRHGYRR